MLNLLILLLILIFAYLNFGLFLVTKTKLKLTVLEQLLFSFVLAVAINVSLIVGLGHVFGDSAYYYLIVTGVIGLATFVKHRQLYQLAWQKIKLNPCLIGLFGLGIFLLASGLMFSGFVKDGAIFLQDLYDSSWHMALQKELLASFPPRHPSNPAILLKNYHYFYDVFIASLAKFSQISLLILNYRVSQIIIASLMILSAYAFGRRLKNRGLGIILALLVIFAGNFGYFIPLFLPGQSWSESSFWVSQTFSMLVNPQLIFSFASLFLVLLLMTKELRSRRQRHFLIIPLIVTSIGFKTYGWMIMSLLYAVDLLIEFLTDRKLSSILIGLLYLLIMLPFLYLITGFHSGSFFWQPLWFIDSMIEAPDRVNNIMWRFLLDHYRLKKNWPRIVWLRAKELAIFYFGNLGMRSIFLALPIFLNKKELKNNFLIIVLVTIGFLFSSIFPLLFLQTGTVWNSIQFWYYALIFANILAALVILKILSSLKRLPAVIFSLIFIILALPAFVQTMRAKWQSFHPFDLKQQSFLAELNADDHLLICPEDSILFKSAFINAHTPATVYLSDEGQLNLVEADLTAVEGLKKIFSEQNLVELNQLVQNEQISHILCSKRDFNLFIQQSYPDQEVKIIDWSVYALE